MASNYSLIMVYVCLWQSSVALGLQDEVIIVHLFFVYHSRKLCTCILLTIDHWWQFYSRLNDKARSRSIDRLCALVSHITHSLE